MPAPKKKGGNSKGNKGVKKGINAKKKKAMSLHGNYAAQGDYVLAA